MRGPLFSLLLAAIPLSQGSPLSYAAGPIQSRQGVTQNFTDYLYLYFTGERISNGEQVYAAVSNDNSPKQWTTLNSNQPILTSDIGVKGIRDPSLIISPDRSKFYLIATDLKVYGLGWGNGTCFTCPESGSKSIIVWTSADLVNWTGPASHTVSPPEAGMTWAPDAIWDPSREKYMLFWTSKLEGKLIILRCWTEDFETFTETEVFGEFGMDLTIAEDKGRFYMVSKNGPDELIQQNVADKLDGPWEKVSDRIGKEGGMPAGEGPLVFRDNVDQNKWHLWIDDYMRGDGGYLPFETDDIASGKWVPSEGVVLPKNPRHGYVVPITTEERQRIVAAYAAPVNSG